LFSDQLKFHLSVFIAGCVMCITSLDKAELDVICNFNLILHSVPYGYVCVI